MATGPITPRTITGWALLQLLGLKPRQSMSMTTAKVHSTQYLSRAAYSGLSTTAGYGKVDCELHLRGYVIARMGYPRSHRYLTLPYATVVTYLTLPVTVWSIFLRRPFRLPYVSSLLRQQHSFGFLGSRVD